MQSGIDAGALVEVAAFARSVPEYELGVLEIMKRRLGFDVAMFKRTTGVSGYGLDPHIERACGPHWHQFTLEGAPVVEAALAQRGVAVDVDVLGWKRLERLSYYQRLMRLHGGTASAYVCLMRQGLPASILCLGRTTGSFSDRELEYLRSIEPVLSVCETAALAAPVAPRPLAQLYASLTPREREVLSHLRFGHTNAQIALALGSAERTVRNQLSSIYEKLGVGSRAEAAALCTELGVLAGRVP